MPGVVLRFNPNLHMRCSGVLAQCISLSTDGSASFSQCSALVSRKPASRSSCFAYDCSRMTVETWPSRGGGAEPSVIIIYSLLICAKKPEHVKDGRETQTVLYSSVHQFHLENTQRYWATPPKSGCYICFSGS